MIYESREREGLFPEQIDHVFEIIDSLFAKDLMVAKRVLPVSPLALEIFADKRRSELRFAHGHRYSKGKYRVDKTMRVTDADKSFTAKAADLIRVIWNNMHLLNQLHFRYTFPKLRVDIVVLVPEELFRSLLFSEKVRIRRDHSYANNLFVERNEP